jgi:hypothetical protein
MKITGRTTKPGPAVGNALEPLGQANDLMADETEIEPALEHKQRGLRETRPILPGKFRHPHVRGVPRTFSPFSLLPSDF